MNTRNALWINKGKPVPPASEYVEMIIKADSNWRLYLATAWLGDGGYYQYYHWNIYIDNNLIWDISWRSGQQSYREITSWLTPDSFHNVKIYPNEVDPNTLVPNYWWLKAFGMGWNCNAGNPLSYRNPVADYLYEVIYDWSYMGYANSEFIIGDNFKCLQYAWCSNLTKVLPEVDISQVMRVGTYYREWQYAECISLLESATEAISDSITTIGVWFREHQYYGCTSLLTAADEHDPEEMRNPWHSYREWQYRNCVSLSTTWAENPPSTLQGWQEYKFNQYDGCTWITTISRVEYLSVTGGSDYRGDQFKNCWSSEHPLTAYFYWDGVITWSNNSLGLSNANVYRIYVPSNLVSAYQNASQRSNIDDNKFVWM